MFDSCSLALWISSVPHVLLWRVFWICLILAYSSTSIGKRLRCCSSGRAWTNSTHAQVWLRQWHFTCNSKNQIWKISFPSGIALLGFGRYQTELQMHRWLGDTSNFQCQAWAVISSVHVCLRSSMKDRESVHIKMCSQRLVVKWVVSSKPAGEGPDQWAKG